MARDLSKLRINLEKATVLLVDETPLGLDVLSTIVNGFGIRERLRAASAFEAMDLVKTRTIDLFLVEASLRGMDGYDFIAWLRRCGLKPNAYAPAILITGHTPADKVAKARDCGANYIVTKPLTMLAMLERIVFVARDARPFVECDTYVGPDRRFKNVGPPPGTPGRRRTDREDPLGGFDLADLSEALLQRKDPA